MHKIFKILLTLGVIVPINNAWCQYAPAAGETGSTAIHKDNPAFVDWAKTCTVKRGFINKKDTTVKYTQDQVTSNRAFFGNTSMALGKPGGALDCLSLGDSGVAVLTFNFPIRNGEGADFAIFENGMKMPEPPYQYFLELAFVEASTDGKRFVRFPAVSNTQTITQEGTFGQIDPKQIHNFAGKYVADYGTPFDLQDLKDSTGINTDSINFIRLIDVTGCIEPAFASRDSKGQIINDPFPTEFWSGGFDLDAVGVIHSQGITGVEQTTKNTNFKIYPNPLKAGSSLVIDNLEENNKDLEINIWSVSGKKAGTWITQTGQKNLEIPNLSKGLYMLHIKGKETNEIIKLMVE
jgi:hypothetical protein